MKWNSGQIPKAGARPSGRRALAVGSAAALVVPLAAVVMVPGSRDARVEARVNAHAPIASRATTTLASTWPPQDETNAQRFTGKVGVDLSKSLLAAGVPERQGREYVAVLDRAIHLAGGLTVDDKFDLVVARDRDGKLGELLYVGLDRVGRADLELLRWTDGRSVIWVNGDVVSADNPGIAIPVHGRMTSGFGKRFHPILGYVRFHDGIDLAAAAGTPIVAAADGRVLRAGWRGGYGREVELAHQGGMETTYGHMSAIAARVGQTVRQGQLIGWVGSSGLSTGPHLHFQVTQNGRPIDPMSVKMGSESAHLEGEKLHQVQGALRNLLLEPTR